MSQVAIVFNTNLCRSYFLVLQGTQWTSVKIARSWAKNEGFCEEGEEVYNEKDDIKNEL